MRSLGFVDRLVAPWMETAQRSASMRLFSGYAQAGLPPSEPRAVSWVFPRPWYQDELDWMAAARQVSAQPAPRPAAPTLLTTRGTYVPPAVTAPQVAMPSALYEYVAPSLSLAANQPAASRAGLAGPPSPRGEAYSPLVSLAAVQAAELMSRAVAPLAMQRTGAAAAAGPTAMTPGLRSVLSSILERAASRTTAELPASRLSQSAPELVTPPAPRPGGPGVGDATEHAGPTTASRAAAQAAAQVAAEVADRYAEQRVRIGELQRVAQQAAQREAVARVEAARAQSVPTPAPGMPASSTAEVRAAADRAERELRQRIGSAQATEAQRQAAAASVAERAGGQRLHEQARAEAAAHARTPAELPRGEATGALRGIAAVEPRASAGSPEVAAAIAGLPPELSAMLASASTQRPERAMQAIRDLNEALRTVELLARSSAAGTAFETTLGPRLMMPAGLGGLVSAVDRAQTLADRPAGLGRASLAPLSLGQSQIPGPAQSAERRAARDLRVPTLSWLSAAPRSDAAPTTALGATTTASPAALSHVAWADRWLARFAGAAPQSLDMISAAAAATPSVRMQALADAAPGTVFVVPDFVRGDLDPAQRTAVSARFAVAATAPAAAAPAGVPSLRLINPPPVEPLRRFDDNAETPDDVFAAISASAARGRSGSSRPAAAPPAAVPPAVPAAPSAERSTLADLVAHAAPAAPGAGLSAQLASSPFAPALRHVLPLPSAASFDVRSLFGAGLGATYLAGLIGPALRELTIGAQMVPTWASWSDAPLNQPFGQAPDANDRIDRMVPTFDAAYVTPDAPAELDGREGGLRAASGAFAGSPAEAAGSVSASEATAASDRQRIASQQLTTLRSALLSWDVASTGEAGAPELVPAAFAAAPLGASAGIRDARTSSTARMMIEAMSLPMLAETADPAAAWSSPGMVAERAHTFSVVQERSTADLALDFVTPELVLAARVYGLGPAEAAQASRLALAGPGQLGAMASTVDRTFVEAMSIGREAKQIEAERRRGGAVAAAGGGDAVASAPELSGAAGAPSAARATITTAFPTADGDIAAFAPAGDIRAAAPPPPSKSLFGVDRRAPRGAFLWPAAAIAALGMTASGSDGQLSMSVAALELLAAQVVAELGTYSALSELDAATRGGSGVAGMAGARGEAAAGAFGEPASAARSSRLAGAAGDISGAGAFASPGAEPGESEVLSAAAASVPAARRARFDALYVALGQSTAGRSWSPAARAARALALAGRGDDAGSSARERAAAAWDVLPVVYASAGDTSLDAGTGAGSERPTSASALAAAAMASFVSPGGLGRSTPTARGAQRARDAGERSFVAADGGGADWPQVTAAPGLAGLSARAGDALGAYVAAAAPPSAPVADSGAVHRAPTAAPEYVQPARSGGRYGGGEVEIPPWFEAAARKMLAERGGDPGISLAELTLVTAAPAAQIAASSIAQPKASAPGAADGATAQPGAPKIDIEKLAFELYRDLMVMMDVARERNGDPYL